MAQVTQKLGMEILWPEISDSALAILVDIVFVHGLHGGRQKTWTKKKWTTLWPRDLLPKDVENARIMTWGYDANALNFFESTSQTSIFGHALQLLSDLADKRRSASEKTRPIIFVAHSLGGLVVKDALYQSHSEGIQEIVHNPRLAAIKKATIGVIFAGTPHRGSDAGKWAAIAAHLSKFILKNPNMNITNALQRGAETTERLQSDFSRILSKLRVYTFSEDRDFPGVGIIVDKDSTIIGFPHEVRQKIPANHKMMVKFQDESDIGYQRIKGAILNLIEDWEEQVEAEKEKERKTKESQQPNMEEVRNARSLRFATYSGSVVAENSVQGDMFSQGDIIIGSRSR